MNYLYGVQGVECSNHSVPTIYLNDLGQFGNDWPFSFQGLLRDFSSCLPPQYRQRRPSRVRRRYLVGLIEFSQLRRRVVTGDAAVLVSQQDLPVFLRHDRGATPATTCASGPEMQEVFGQEFISTVGACHLSKLSATTHGTAGRNGPE